MTEPTAADDPRLALAERADLAPGWPQWIRPALRLSRGLDPLGLQTITQDRIMPLLLPGVLVLSQRARLFSLYPFLVAEYQRLGGATTNTALSAFLKEREFDYAVAVQLCPNGCGDNSAGAVGADRARPAGREAKAGAATVPRQESVKSFLGGYGLYYRSPLTDLGVVVARGTPTADGEATPVDAVMPGGLGERLAGAFRAAISDTAYYRKYLRSVERSVPTAALRELAVAACLCRLPERPGERELLYEAFFAPQAAGLIDACEQRRCSFALFLRELDRDGGVSDSTMRFAPRSGRTSSRCWRQGKDRRPRRLPTRWRSGRRSWPKSTCRKPSTPCGGTSAAEVPRRSPKMASQRRRSMRSSAPASVPP
jgi:hypothetical protein